MKSRNAIIDVLGGLSPQDRKWIVTRLSPRAHALLLDTPNREVPQSIGPGSPQTADSNAVAALRTASAGAIARVLNAEPAWVAHALLTHPSLDRPQVRSGLSAALRRELALLEASGTRWSATLVAAVCERIRATLAGPPKESTGTTLKDLLGTRLARFAGVRFSRSP